MIIFFIFPTLYIVFIVMVGVCVLGLGRALRTIKLWKNKELRRKSKRIEKKRDVTNKKGKRR